MKLHAVVVLMNAGLFVGIERAISLRYAGQFFHTHVISWWTCLPPSTTPLA